MMLKTFVSAAACYVVVSGFPAKLSASQDAVVYSKDIQPLLAKHCLLCHGPDEAAGGLRLDLAEHATAKLESGGHAIVPGSPDASELIRRVTSDDEFERMPPEGEPLTERELQLLNRWIQKGAKFEVHWAYRPPSQPDLPAVNDDSWGRNEIDRFVLARLEANGLQPSPQAPRATLIKRLHYDLTGLAPAASEVDAFVHDERDEAYPELVDRLLASKHFGERWGRHWLDKARYADSDGYEKDRPRPNAWRYRDWVIRAINDDMPYDQFSVEQLAGDLLPNPTASQKLATAFHRQTLTNTEGGTDQEEFRVEATFDRTETTAAVWMGLTMTCARCHSHKYDQITQQEYYQLFGFFNDANEGSVEIPTDEQSLQKYKKAKAKHDDQLAELTRRYQEAKKTLRPEIANWTVQMTESLNNNDRPVAFQPATVIDSKTASEAEIQPQDDGGLIVSGPSPDQDKYTVVVNSPEAPLTGLKIETLADPSLGGKGPGRTAHGNFVLSEIRLYGSNAPDFKAHTRIDLVGAEADFSQGKFPPEDALSGDPKTGWAISPQMGKDHSITCVTEQPIEVGRFKYLQIVLDQKYGGEHTIGRFRLSTMTGFDPLKALPEAVAKALRKPAEKRTDEEQNLIADHFAARDPEAGKLKTQLEKKKTQAPASPMMSVRVIVPADRTTKLLHRGDFQQPADVVSNDDLEVIRRTHPLQPASEGAAVTRSDLAKWLVDPNHPLTSRVTVNHAWAHLFGRGIVPTLNDFGVRGEMPTHPQLLDWLAWKFPRDMNWSRKDLIRTIVMSATYRQSSDFRAETQKVDPTNGLLARQNRVRVEAEIVRDLYLAASGLLSKKIGGPSVFPPLPPGVAELSYANNFKWKTSEGEDRYRRGMYTFFKRTSPHPTLVSFDCPDSNTTAIARGSSNTPLQALATLNNDVFTETAQAMVKRVVREAGPGDLDRLRHALRLCVIREPHESEVENFEELLKVSRAYYAQHAGDAEKIVNRHRVDGISAEENAAWVVTMRMILNLDEFIVRD